jgi:hypothetical protein
MRKYYFLLLILFISFFTNAQNADSIFIKKLSDEIMVNGQAYDNLRQLCKQIGNRLSGSPQMYKAEAWGVLTLEKSGADKVWKQPCMVPHWVRGGKDQLWTSVLYRQIIPKCWMADWKINIWMS